MVFMRKYPKIIPIFEKSFSNFLIYEQNTNRKKPRPTSKIIR